LKIITKNRGRKMIFITQLYLTIIILSMFLISLFKATMNKDNGELISAVGLFLIYILTVIWLIIIIWK